MMGKWVKGLVAAAACAPAPASADRYNLQTPQTIIAHAIYDLHTLIFVICLVIFVVVFGAMFYAIIMHRKAAGHQAKQFHENAAVEIAWTIVPFLILIGMAYPATSTLIAMKDTSRPDLTIKITGYQWKWSYDYLQEGLSFYSSLATPRDQLEGKAPKGVNYLLEVDNPLVVPVGKKVRIILTANDVIHAWWVPALGVKQDAIPGFVRDSWLKVDKPGTYRGQCAELCGKDHAYMPIVVEAVEPEKFALWVAQQKKTMVARVDDRKPGFTLEELKARGETVYAINCQVCHQSSGRGQPPAYPSLVGAKGVTGSKHAYIELLLKGKNAMPAWTQLSDIELAAVITYTRNNWGNNTGDAVHSGEIKAARK